MMTVNASNEGAAVASVSQQIEDNLARTTVRLDRTAALLDELRKRQAADRERQAELMAELGAKQRETARQMQETDRRLRKAENTFTSQWGRLVESLVEGDLVPLLLERGIVVEGTSRRSRKRRNGEHFEIDILATNGTQVVVVEVKTTLRPEDVRHFVDKLKRFQEWHSEYARHSIYGAVAYLESSDAVTTHAERQGLFVVRATGSSASILNAPDFQPRVFS